MMEVANENILKSATIKPKMPESQGDAAKQIFAAYSDMFAALTYIHLLGGNTLGQSWYNAIGQIESFINTKDKFNAVTGYMKKILNVHRKDLAKKMMLDENRDKIILVSPEKRTEMTAQLNARVNAAMQTINQQIEKYRERAEKLKKQLTKEAKKRAKAMTHAAKQADTQRATAQQKQTAEESKIAPMAAAPTPDKTNAPAPEKATTSPAMVRPPRPDNRGNIGPLNRPVITPTPQQEQARAATAPEKSAIKTAVEPQKAPTTAQKLYAANQNVKALTAQRDKMKLFISLYKKQQHVRGAA